MQLPVWQWNDRVKSTGMLHQRNWNFNEEVVVFHQNDNRAIEVVWGNDVLKQMKILWLTINLSMFQYQEMYHQLSRLHTMKNYEFMYSIKSRVLTHRVLTHIQTIHNLHSNIEQIASSIVRLWDNLAEK
jgi:hypothetical protein